MARAKTGYDAGTTYREDTLGMKENQNYPENSIYP